MSIGKSRGHESNNILGILFHPVMKLVAVSISK